MQSSAGTGGKARRSLAHLGAGYPIGNPRIQEFAFFSLVLISKCGSTINNQSTLVGGNHHQSRVVLEMVSAETGKMSEQSVVQFAS